MPKMKSKRGAVKRFKVSGTGKVKRHHAFASHILTHKSPKRKRKLKKAGLVSYVEVKRVRTLILA
jgi:large subunit ribosomal protein L35